MCLNCVSEMNHAFAFVQKCERSERALRSLLSEPILALDSQMQRPSSETPILTSKEETDTESNSGRCSPNTQEYQAEVVASTDHNTNDFDGCVTESKVEDYLYHNKIELAATEQIKSTPLKPKTIGSATADAIKDFIAENTLKFICSHCKASFSSRRSLSLHVNSRKCMQQSYECDICNKVFVKKRNLIRHLQRMHRMMNKDTPEEEPYPLPNNKRKYKCHLCPKGELLNENKLFHEHKR